MGADLTTSSWVRNESVVLTEDSLIILEQESRQDRMRKILFDQVASMVVWKRFPLGRSLGFVALLGAPAATITLTVASSNPYDRSAQTDWRIAAVCMLGLLLLILLRYIICGKTFIRIGYSGNVRELAFVARPGRMGKFLDRLVANIRKAQQEAILRAEARDAKQQSDERLRLAAHADGASEPAPPAESPGASVQEA